MNEETKEKKGGGLLPYFIAETFGDQSKWWDIVQFIFSYVAGIAILLVIARSGPNSWEEGLIYIAVEAADLLVPLCIILSVYSIGWTAMYYLGRLILYLTKLIMRSK